METNPLEVLLEFIFLCDPHKILYQNLKPNYFKQKNFTATIFIVYLLVWNLNTDHWATDPLFFSRNNLALACYKVYKLLCEIVGG